MKIYELFCLLSEENGIEYMDLYPLIEKIGLKKEDYEDEMHLNGNGAKKVSIYIGNYLMES